VTQSENLDTDPQHNVMQHSTHYPAAGSTQWQVRTQSVRSTMNYETARTMKSEVTRSAFLTKATADKLVEQIMQYDNRVL